MTKEGTVAGLHWHAITPTAIKESKIIVQACLLFQRPSSVDNKIKSVLQYTAVHPWWQRRW